MEDTRRAIRQGRLLAGEGLYAHALDTWKAALSGAYSQQDYAGLFVLSCNVGEACVELAAQSKNGVKAAKQLQEGQESLDYALQVVEQCSLRNVLGGYRALYRGVRRAEALTRKAAELMDKLRQAEVEETKKKKKEEEVVVECTTCGEAGGVVVLDENDGCYYCKMCYDEYYTAEQVDAVKKERMEVGDTDEEEAVAVRDVAEVESGVEDDLGGEDIEVEIDAAAKGGVEIEVATVSEPSAVLSPATNGAQDEKRQDRVRYERVELGSLEDFLAGKLRVENNAEQIETQRSDHTADVAELLTPMPADTNPPDEGVPDHDALAKNEDHTADTSLPESDSACEEDPRSDEDAAAVAVAAVPTKLEYSIAELLELRKQSPAAVPVVLLSSPVFDDGTAPPPARNKPTNSNSRKKSSAKKTARSAVASRQSKADAADQVDDDTDSISPLPTLDLCNMMRAALQEQRDGADPHCSSSGILETALFSSAHVRLVAERPDNGL